MTAEPKPGIVHADAVPNLTDEQIARVSDLAWYHAYDFGSHQTPGRFEPDQPANMTLFGVMDLLAGIEIAGTHCLDVGPAHGLISIGLALAGAADVAAINLGQGKPAQITLAEEIFDVSVDYHSNTPLSEVGTVFDNGALDIAVCAGVMYHLLNPADAFFQLRPLIRHGGLLVLETVVVVDDEPARFVLNSERDDFLQPTSYFLPNPAMLLGIAKLASFEVLATRLNSPRRFSMVCRAVLPDEVPDRSPLCVQMHDIGFEDPLFNLGDLTPPEEEPIAFTGKPGHQILDVKQYQPTFRPHPAVIDTPVGKRFGQ